MILRVHPRLQSMATATSFSHGGKGYTIFQAYRISVPCDLEVYKRCLENGEQVFVFREDEEAPSSILYSNRMIREGG